MKTLFAPWKASPKRQIIALWLAWAFILVGFQTMVDARYQPMRPDRALDWTPQETGRTSQNDKPYLLETFMNRQVSWDSEFYISIAIAGYDDPAIRVADTPNGPLALNHAFFPLYPLLMSFMTGLLTPLGMNAIATASLAGVLIALGGTLLAMYALYDIARAELDESGGLRASFYLLIFPSSFFLAQVYTEGLFIGLSFSALALMRRKNWLWAGTCAMLATWTRATGGLLIIPLWIAWLLEIRNYHLQNGLWPSARSLIVNSASMTLPLVAYLVWRAALGHSFELVEANFFGRALLNVGAFWDGFQKAITSIINGDNSQMRVYYLLEFGAVLIALIACLATWRRYPLISLYGIAALFVSVTSGAPQSLIRYVLVIPSLFIMPARLGANIVFDRAWTTACILLLGMQVSLFTFDMWVA